MVKLTSVLLAHGPNKAFGATDRNGNSISAAVTDDTLEND